MTEFNKGDHVVMEHDGRQYDAQVVIASPNSVSLMLAFEAIIAGHVGMMPLLLENGVYHSIVTGDEVTVRRAARRVHE